MEFSLVTFLVLLFFILPLIGILYIAYISLVSTYPIIKAIDIAFTTPSFETFFVVVIECLIYVTDILNQFFFSFSSYYDIIIFINNHPYFFTGSTMIFGCLSLLDSRTRQCYSILYHLHEKTKITGTLSQLTPKESALATLDNLNFPIQAVRYPLLRTFIQPTILLSSSIDIPKCLTITGEKRDFQLCDLYCMLCDDEAFHEGYFFEKGGCICRFCGKCKSLKRRKEYGIVKWLLMRHIVISIIGLGDDHNNISSFMFRLLRLPSKTLMVDDDVQSNIDAWFNEELI